DVVAAERLHLPDAGRRRDVDLGEIRTDDVDAGEDQAAALQFRLQPRADFTIALVEFDRHSAAANVQVCTRFAGLRYAIECARDFAIDQDNAFVTVFHFRPEFLNHERFAEHGLKQFDQRAEISVTGLDTEHRRAAVAVERLDDDVFVFGAERLHVGALARDERRRHQIEKIEDEQFFGRVADVRGVVDDKRFWVNALEQMRRRDVGHVEWRVLPQQNDVELGEIFDAEI